MSAPNSAPDYYEVLQVSPSASPEVIEAAYNGLMRKYGSDPDPAVRELRADVAAAYDVLSDARRRADYDDQRAGTPPRAEAIVSERPPEPVRFGGATVVACPRDPDQETALRCSRCETPICPKCLVQTPVGARCRDCARLAKSPIYTVQGQYLARAIAAGGIGGLAMGLIWGLASATVAGIAFGGPIVALLLGAGLGFGFTRIMELAVNRKRGPVIVGCAAGGIVLATVIQSAVLGFISLWVIVAAAAGLYFAYQNLK